MLHFTKDINDLTFDYYTTLACEQASLCEFAWRPHRPKVSLLAGYHNFNHTVWRYVCVTDVYIRVALYLTVSTQNRNTMSSFSGTARSTNSIAWKRWLLWNKWLLQWSKKRTGNLMIKTSMVSLVMSIRFIFGDDSNAFPWFSFINSETNRRIRYKK